MNDVTILSDYLRFVHQSAERRLHDLRYLFLEVTQNCNLQCIHCGSDCVKDSTVPYLPPDLILKSLAEVADRYNPNKIMIAMTGGEPLCYPRVFDLGLEIYKMGFPWGMVSNGLAWTARTVEKAQASGMHTATISLDGLESEHNWLRGSARSFKGAVKAIRMITEADFLYAFDVVTCVNRRNLDQLDSVRSLLIELGVRQWRIFTISPIGRATQTPDLFLSGAQFRRLLDRILDYREQGQIDVEYAESGFLGPCYEQRVRGYQSFCKAGVNIGGLMVNGDILACPNIDRRLAQGNITTDSLVDVWENRFQAFRDRRWMRTGECRSCQHWRLCQGNSIHLWDLDNGRTRLCHLSLIKSD